MRVLLVNYEYPGVTANCGGGGEVTRQLAVGLTDRGHDVEVVTDDPDRHYATFPVRSYREIAARLTSFDPDVVNGHFTIPSSVGLPRLCRQHNTPLVVTGMGADIYDPTRYGWLRPLTARVNQYLAAHAAQTVVPSRDMADRVSSRWPTPPTLIPYGIDPDVWTWRPRPVPEQPHILTAARLVERKNLTAACEAVCRLRARGFDAQYRIVGTGPRQPAVEALAADRPWLSVAGYVDDLQTAFDDADLFFLPSHHEAFGMVYLEALAAGLPVIASSNGGQTDIVRGSVGETAPPDRPGLLADALADVLGAYPRYQQATQDYVADQFHVDQMITGYETVYQEAQAGG